eukprot:7213380-Alexandrium_andersonii.AAC.1
MESTMQRQITYYMDEHNIHILALQGTRHPQTTQYVTAGYTFFRLATEGDKSMLERVSSQSNIKRNSSVIVNWPNRLAM